MQSGQRNIIFGLYRSTLTPDLIDTALSLGVTEIDCATTYVPRGNHASLPVLGSDGSRLRLSSKVGYVWDDKSARFIHSLNPDTLREECRRIASQVGSPLRCLYLHNPEASLGGGSEVDYHRMNNAVEVLRDAVDSGLADTWGISTWNPGVILAVLSFGPMSWYPDRLMTHCGVLCLGDKLRLTKELIDVLAVTKRPQVIGASGLGGAYSHVLESQDFRPLMRGDGRITKIAAIIRLAFEFPRLDSLAVSTRSVTHLVQCVQAASLEINPMAVEAFVEEFGKRANCE